MKCVLSALLLLALITGGHCQTGGLGQPCATGDTCTDTNAVCDTTDATNKFCKCQRRWIKVDTKCVRGATQPCHDSQCHSNLKCIDSACFCDTETVGYARGTNGSVACACPTNQAIRSSTGKCAGMIGHPCVNGECIDNVICESGTCKCDPKQFLAAGSAGDTSCSCDTTKATGTGTNCKLKIDETTCTAASDCVSGDLAKCDSSSGTGTCKCDAAKNSVANAGKTACVCDAKSQLEGTVCKLKITQTTCSVDTDCVSVTFVKCDTATAGGTCTCDAAKNSVANAGNTACDCTAKYHLEGTECKLKIDETTCAADTDCVSGALAKCDSSSGTGTCTCDATKNSAANVGKTACDCAAKYHLEGTACKLKIDETTCSADTDCVSGAFAKCDTSSGTGTCKCDATKNTAANAGKTACVCDPAKASGTLGSCKLLLGQAGCGNADDCVSGTGVVCSPSTGCGCDTSMQLVKNSASTGCICDLTKATGAPGSCKLKLGQGTCSKTEDCEPGTGVICGSDNKCGCNATAQFSLPSGGSACVCPTDHTPQAAFDRQPASCVLKVGAACNCSTAHCVFGAYCDVKTGKCLCDASNNFAAAAIGAISCPCDADSQPMTVSTRTYCGKKIGGACLLEKDTGTCASKMTCKSKVLESTTVYGCQCDSGTENICDGTCSGGADNLTVSIVMLMVGLMTSALIRLLK